MTDNKLTHFDASGNAVMVDVSEKTITFREATAHGIITMNAEAAKEFLAYLQTDRAATVFEGVGFTAM